MPYCSNCGRPVSTGQYFEIDNKIICVKCLQEDHNISKKYTEQKRNKLISCPSCGERYNSTLKRCPHCQKWNPIYDYNTKEVFKNILVGSLFLWVPYGQSRHTYTYCNISCCYSTDDNKSYRNLFQRGYILNRKVYQRDVF